MLNGSDKIHRKTPIAISNFVQLNFLLSLGIPSSLLNPLLKSVLCLTFLSGLEAIASIPGRVEAEDYDTGGAGVSYFDGTSGNAGGEYRNDDVDIYRLSESLGDGYYVDQARINEWLEYTITDVTPGDYYFNLRCSRSLDSTTQISIEINGEVFETLTSKPTYGWQKFTDIPSTGTITLDGSPVVVRVNFLNRRLSVDYFEFLEERPAYAEGFINVTQDPGALLGEGIADTSDNVARTIVMDFHKGYLIKDTRFVPGGSHSMQVWDVSKPSEPAEILDSRLVGRRPMHAAFNYLPGDGRVYHINTPGSYVVNMTDPLNLVQETPSGYNPIDIGSFGAHVFPYQYSPGESIRIYDVRTGTSSYATGHFFSGQPIPLGNLLLFAGARHHTRRIAAYDISNPLQPEFLNALDLRGNTTDDPDTNTAYEVFIWKHYLVLPNVTGTDDVVFIDFSDPSNLRVANYYNGDGTYGSGLPGRTRYAQFQDNFMFLGGAKYNMTPLENDNDPILVQALLEQNGEYMLPVGNLLMSADNTHQSGVPEASSPNFFFRIFAHQAEPDKTAPTVAYHIPLDGGTAEHVKSRIGVVIHETLNYDTINPTTFRVFPTTGGNDVSGVYVFHDKDILTFTPDSDLQEATEYTVLIDGIQDVSGNAMGAYSFTFTTQGAGGFPPIQISDFGYTGYPASVGVPIQFNVTASGGDGNLEYRWIFGDGTIIEWGDGTPNPTHTYTEPGHYSALIQVRDGSGNQKNQPATLVTVIEPITGNLPLNSSQIIANATGELIWSVFPDNNRVLAVDADDNSIVYNVDLGVVADPRSLSEDSNGNIWVTCLDADRIAIIDGSDGTVAGSISLPPGSSPDSILFDHAKLMAYVSLNGSGQILAINSNTLEQSYHDAGPTPTALAINSAGTQLLLNRFISPDSHGEVWSFDISSDINLDSTLTLQKDTVSEDNGNQGKGLPNYLAGVIISHDDDYAYVTSKKDNIDRGEFLSNEPLTFETSVRAIISRINLNTGLEDFNNRLDLDNSSQPTAMAFSSFGDYLFVAFQGNNRVEIIDTYTLSNTSTLACGMAPQGLYFNPTSYKLYIKNLNDRSITIYDLTTGLETGNFSNSPVSTVVLGSEIMSPDVMRGKQVFYNASDKRMTADEYISCALCHQDGDHDGRTWDFTERGEGLRNTTNLRGRSGMAHGNVHWSANFDEIQDFELDIVNEFGGTGFIEGGPNLSLGDSNANRSDDLDALAAYVSSLGAESVEKSPERNSQGGLTADGYAGKRLFEGELMPLSGNALNCISCHQPENDGKYTDSSLGVNVTLHNVGTIKDSSGGRLGEVLGGIDTPTLLGVHASAPYFHDGSATTLEGVFNPLRTGAGPSEVGNAHDLTHTGFDLTNDEIASLVAYLKQLDGQETGDTDTSTWLLSWIRDIGPANNDFDGDELTNMQEYILGGNPTVPDINAQSPKIVREGNLYFEFNERTNDPSLNYKVMSSTNLVDWVEATLPAPQVEAMGDNFEKRSYQLPTDKPLEFFRIEIDEN